MDASNYDRRIGFERFSELSRDALNEPVGAWLLIGQTMAKRVDTRDVEKMNAGREASALMARFEVRSTQLTRALTPADKLVLGGVWDGQGVRQTGQVWDIEGVKEKPGETHRAIEITAAVNRENQA